MFDPTTAILLVGIALFAGVGITAIGPGGIFVTIALVALTPLSSAGVAGTASATFVATGLVGSLAYLRSGELASGVAREAAILLSLASILGALAGVRLNVAISDAVFATLLAGFVALVGVLIVYRELVGLTPRNLFESGETTRRAALAAVGFGVGVAGGLLGVGGPVLAVPILVVLGVPMLLAVAVAQVQSIFVSAFATVGYLAVDAVSLPLVALVGVPQVVGVVAGWKLAHLVEPGRLRIVLGVVLVAITPVIAP
ncbi:TSUP family transporter [Haloferacaceae archaeon DSL9]